MPADAPKTSQIKRAPFDWGKWIKRVFGAAVVIAVAVGLVFSFLPKPVIVDFAVIESGELEVTVDEDGYTRVIDRYTVSAPLSGNLARIELRPGDPVKAGDVIARIEPAVSPLMDARSRAETEARLRAAEAAVRQAKATSARARVAKKFADDNLEETRGLHSRGSISRHALEVAELEAKTAEQDLASSRFGERVAKGEVDMAKAALRRLERASGRSGKPSKSAASQTATDAEDHVFEVIAPVDGRVLHIAQQSEGLVQAGTPLLEVADPDNLEIVADVLTTDAVRIEPGAQVHVDGWGGETPLEGRVRMVEPSAYTEVSALGVEEQRVNVLIDLVGEPAAWAALGDGYRVRTRIVVWRGQDLVTAPVSALFRQADGWATFVRAGDLASLRAVEIGHRHGLTAEIVSGLEPGDVVIVHPGDELHDGVEVTGKGD